MTTDNEKPMIGRPSGTGDSPLREFDGTPISYEWVNREFEGRKYRNVLFKFIDVTPIKTDEPFPFPVADISIPYADLTKQRKGTESRWSAFSESVIELVGEDADALDRILNKPQRWSRENTIKLRQPLRDEEGNPLLEDKNDGKGPQQVWGDVETPAWRIMSIEGVAASSGGGGSSAAANASNNLAHLVDLVEGKTEQEFYKVALEDQQIMRDPALVSSLTDRSFISNMIGVGKIKRSPEGILSKA